jgi:sarcosine oxidase gamma subunit
MRDFAAKWTALPDWATARLELPDLAVTSVDGLEQMLVSGDLAALVAGGMTPVGFNEIASGDPYAIRLARDRALVVSARPIPIGSGWDAAGYGMTVMTGGYHVFAFSGSGIGDLLARATTLDPASTGPSAAVRFAGADAIVYRHGADALRVHVERGLAPYLWQWLTVALPGPASPAG